MVALTQIQSSNAQIAFSLSPGLVAVFVGATSGIGELSLKAFAQHAIQPRIYFIGRSQEAADRITAECKSLNSQGEYIFLMADVSLIRAVDDVCQEIKKKEKAINLLFLKTSETLHFAAALAYYSRTRFILDLLPLLQQATGLRRVVTVFAGGKEGPIDTNDYQGWKVPLMSMRGHASSMVTLSLEAIAQKAPDVTFIHNFPGPVKTNLARGTKGVAMAVMRAIFKVIGPFVYLPNQEVGERHLFLATSARYPPSTASGVAVSSVVPLPEEVPVAKGTDGETGSGVYSIDWDGESAGPETVELLAKLRKQGLVEKLWEHTMGEFTRITGKEAA